MKKGFIELLRSYCVTDAAMTSAHIDLDDVKRRYKRSVDRYNALSDLNTPRVVLVAEWQNIVKCREQLEALAQAEKTYSALCDVFKGELYKLGYTPAAPLRNEELDIHKAVKENGYDMSEAVRSIYQGTADANAYSDIFAIYANMGMPLLAQKAC